MSGQLVGIWFLLVLSLQRRNAYTVSHSRIFTCSLVLPVRISLYTSLCIRVLMHACLDQAKKYGYALAAVTCTSTSAIDSVLAAAREPQAQHLLT